MDIMAKKTTSTKSSAKTEKNESSKACCSKADKFSCCTMEAKKTESKSTNKKTVVKVSYDCGFPNTLFIRGEGISTLSWEKGVPLKNVSQNEWVWECNRPCSNVEFKILINDQLYESGNNHRISYGDEVAIRPQF